jgi:WD40 repeat protein
LLRGILTLLLLLTTPALAASDPTAPILRVETGMHGAVINRLALTDSGRELVTVSDDKTTRRWSLADGSALGILRSPIGEGDHGALYAVAAAGDTIVVGGRTGADDGGTLYLFNRATGAMTGNIPGFAQAISALAFAPDGKRLAVGQQGRGGIVLIDLAAGKMLGQDQRAQGGINWLAFAKDGSLAASAGDGKLRLYDASLALVAEAALPDKDERPWGLAFSPDGATLAVGSASAPRLHLFDAHHLKPMQTLAGESGRSGALSVVAWSSDGRTLAAAGSYKDARERRLIRFWSAGPAPAPAGETEAAGDTVTDLAFLDDGRVVFVSGEPSFGVLARDGKGDAFRHAADQADFRDAWLDAFRVSEDGAVIDFPGTHGTKDRFRFDLLAATLTPNPPPRNDLKRVVAEDPHLAIADWRNGTQPKLDGRVIPLERDEHVRSIAILPGARRVALATDFFLRLEQPNAEIWQQVVPAPAWSVAATGDGRYLVAALGDGTIRWYAAADGREVMSLFVSPRDRRWVVWTPEGFFDHSHDPGADSGETLVGYHLNKGPGKAADFISIAQLYTLFYRRDLVLAKFRRTADADRLVADQLARIGNVPEILGQGPPPRIDLVEACLVAPGDSDCGAAGGTRQLMGARRIALPGAGPVLLARYRLTDRGGGLGRVIIRRDGAALEGDRHVESTDAKERRESVRLPLPSAQGKVREVRFTTESASTKIRSREDEDLVLAVPPPAVPTPAPPPPAAGDTAGPQLYLVAVGVSAYRIGDFRLVNAANDARAVVDLLNQPSPPVYGAAHTTLLLDDDATGPNIAKALSDVAAKARPQDIVVVFLSGHGDSVDGKYFFAPVDFATRHPEEIARARKSDAAQQAAIIAGLFRSDGFGEAQLLPLIEKIQGNLLLVLDTCFSATLADTADAAERKARHQGVAQSVGHETGRFVLAGARDLALDSDGSADSIDGHGLFTAALLKGLQGDADFRRAGVVNVVDLLRYTKKRVADDSQRLKLDQEPFFFFNGTNFFDVRAVAKN